MAVSYFSPTSVTSIRCRLRLALLGANSKKHACALSELRADFEAAGFRFVADHARLRYLRSLHLAVFERI